MKWGSVPHSEKWGSGPPSPLKLRMPERHLANFIAISRTVVEKLQVLNFQYGSRPPAILGLFYVGLCVGPPTKYTSWSLHFCKIFLKSNRECCFEDNYASFNAMRVWLENKYLRYFWKVLGLNAEENSNFLQFHLTHQRGKEYIQINDNMVAKQFPLSRATAFRSAYFLADACSDLSSSSYA